jgi:queuine tRNA-ribosyltransferase
VPDRFGFELLGRDPSSGLRAGLLHTPHGPIPTPGFMPVGTLGSVKALTPVDVRATGAACVLANTYHLVLRPGAETVRRLGGVHGLMRWDGPMLTDSGGFQVFSLDTLRLVSDAGVQFRSHLDGRPVFFSPESVVAAQADLGADLIMPLDECAPANASRAEAEEALRRTQLWWRRSQAAHRRDDQALFGLVQGGMFADLRRAAAGSVAADRPPGFAIGGLSVGEPKALTASLLAETLAHLPDDRPRYLMGVGAPSDLAAYSALGVDLFDCVLPTRQGRNGLVWTDAAGARADLGKRAALDRAGPIRDGCRCLACRGWSLGALAALFQGRSPLAYRLASIHNLTLMADVLDAARQRVLAGARLGAPVAPVTPLAGWSFTLGKAHRLTLSPLSS